MAFAIRGFIQRKALHLPQTEDWTFSRALSSKACNIHWSGMNNRWLFALLRATPFSAKYAEPLYYLCHGEKGWMPLALPSSRMARQLLVQFCMGFRCVFVILKAFNPFDFNGVYFHQTAASFKCKSFLAKQKKIWHNSKLWSIVCFRRESCL